MNRNVATAPVWMCGHDQEFDWPREWGCEVCSTRPVDARVLTEALGGAAATYLPDGDRPAQALSLEETMRRAPARDNADGHEHREPYRGHDIHPARRTGY